MVQVDGSEHWWFEDRGPQCTLLVFIDDATSRLMHLQFVQSESTFAYFNATQRYLERHGEPVAEVIRRMRISEQTFYRWKQKYGGLGVGELRRLKQLEDENRKLKQLVADPSLDKHILQEVLSRKV